MTEYSFSGGILIGEKGDLALVEGEMLMFVADGKCASIKVFEG